MDVAAAVREGVAALRRGNPADAIPLLRRAAEDPDLAAAEDLADLRARVLSLLAQAYLDAGQASEAETWVRQALRLAKRIGDEAGLVEIRALQSRVLAAAMDQHRRLEERREQARIAAPPLDRMLVGVIEPHARAAVYIQKANAEIEVDRPGDAVALATEAVRLADGAGAVRERVLARLTLARADGARAAALLPEAWKIASDADEINLVGAVAKAAELAGVALATLTGPDMSWRVR
jgi:tetratricopeptide (TPR) repeat protein